MPPQSWVVVLLQNAKVAIVVIVVVLFGVVVDGHSSLNDFLLCSLFFWLLFFDSPNNKVGPLHFFTCPPQFSSDVFLCFSPHMNFLLEWFTVLLVWFWFTIIIVYYLSIQAQPIPPELAAKLLGNRVAVSPIVTVEPRRRKFHKPITLTIPVPQAAGKGMINQYNGETPTLRLLCSITGMVQLTPRRY